MDGHAAPMVPSGGFNVQECRKEGSSSNSTEISSSRRDHGDEAQGTARAQKKRKARLGNWSDEQTQQLLDACQELKSRRRMRAPPKWQSICGSVNGKSADECEGRMETLTKSFNKVQKYCAVHHKQFGQLSKAEFKRLKLACKMKSNWYDQMCEIKEQPESAMGVPSCDPINWKFSSFLSPAAAMVCFLAMADFFLAPLYVWFLSVFCSPSMSKMGAKSEIEVC